MNETQASQLPVYAGNDLGAVWRSSATAFRLWAPTAECRSAAAPHCTKVIPGINRQLGCLCFVHGDSSY